jgi:C4-dicarboxylate-specific signal transduction histidine kinase
MDETGSPHRKEDGRGEGAGIVKKPQNPNAHGDGGMKKEPGAVDLRRGAEERLAESSIDHPAGDRKDGTREENERLCQELQIHRIELEMQNEELKKARDEAEAERERYAELYDFAPVGYFTLACNGGTIRRANLAGSRLLGVERSRLVGRPFGGFVSEDGRPAFNAFWGKICVSGETESCDLSLRGKGTGPCHVHIEGTASADGKECRIVALDITARRVAEDELRKLKAELEERVVELETAYNDIESFSYSVAHDLHAPLRAIDGFARMILRQQGDKFGEKTRREFDVIRGSAQTMGQLIDGLLEFSRLGRKPLACCKVDVAALFEEVWGELRIANPDRSMTLRIDVMPPGKGDRTLLKQVIVNLLSNAVKFTRARAEAIIEVGGRIDGNEAVYCVTDNGIGFDMQFYDKLFIMFHRLQGPDEYEGTGVGLALANRIIKRHGGRMWAEGEADKGAAFYFTIPVCRD